MKNTESSMEKQRRKQEKRERKLAKALRKREERVDDASLDEGWRGHWASGPQTDAVGGGGEPAVRGLETTSGGPPGVVTTLPPFPTDSFPPLLAGRPAPVFRSPPLSTGGSASNSPSLASSVSIEVCGGKHCARAGARDLILAFRREVGAPQAAKAAGPSVPRSHETPAATVRACKCMDRCKRGPNVTVRVRDAGGAVATRRYEGVAPTDVASIVRDGAGH